jgi:hypothetical protein
MMSNNKRKVSTTDAENLSGPTESSSETQILWWSIIISLLWLVGFALLIILIVCIEKISKQLDQGGAIFSRVNVEEQAQLKTGGGSPKSQGHCWIILPPLFAILVATSLSIVGANTSCVFVKLVVWSSSSPISDPMSPRLHGMLIAVFGMAAVFQAMAFAVFWTDYCVNHTNIQCLPGDGAVLSRMALCYWLLVALGLYAVRLQSNKNNTSKHNYKSVRM